MAVKGTKAAPLKVTKKGLKVLKALKKGAHAVIKANLMKGVSMKAKLIKPMKGLKTNAMKAMKVMPAMNKYGKKVTIGDASMSVKDFLRVNMEIILLHIPMLSYVFV